MSEDLDPFAGGVKRESVSFKNAAIGTVQTGTVLEAPKLVQARDYDDNKPAFWKNADGTQGNPKMTVVMPLALTEGPAAGEERSLWAPKPSDLFSKLADAQRTLGRRINVGDIVSVKLAGEEVDPDPVKAKKNNPKKIYAVKITAGQADAFGDDAPPF